MDLPGVAEIVPGHPRITRATADLLEAGELPAGRDLYLFANTLHLLPNWREVLRTAAAAARPGALFAVYEAHPDDAAGRWFDLQVHLRSGRVTGLPVPARIEEALAALTGDVVERFSHVAPDDFLNRRFQLTTARITRGGV